MATKYYGLNRGEQNQTYVAEGTSTTSKSLEVVMNDAVGWTKQEFFEALDAIKRHVLERGLKPNS